jgi:integrase
MASITKHGDKWRAHVYRNGMRQTKVFDTQREAKLWAAKTELKLNDLRRSGKTFAQAVELYEQTQTVRKRSQDWERNTLARLLAQIGDEPLDSLTQPRIAQWRDERLKSVSASTVVREANLLRALLRVARLEWHWIDHNPFEGVKLPKENAARKTVWRWQQIRRVLRSGREGKTGETVRAFHVALHTGLRLQEVLTGRYDAGRRVLVLPQTKAGESQEAPVTKRAARVLPKLMQPFTVKPNEASVLFGKLCRQLLITGLTFHDARATALTLLSRRMDVLTLSRISRHQDLRILQQVYYRETAEQIAARL